MINTLLEQESAGNDRCGCYWEGVGVADVDVDGCEAFVLLSVKKGELW